MEKDEWKWMGKHEVHCRIIYSREKLEKNDLISKYFSSLSGGKIASN